MYLFFDTETTGVPRKWNAPVTDLKNWPRMVQIAWVIYNEAGEQLDEQDYIIFPENYTIPYVVTQIHGISTKRAIAEGHDLKKVLELFAKALSKVKVVVAHNIAFDEKIIGAEFLRKKIVHTYYEKEEFCTMKSTTHVTKIEGKFGYKWPKLNELYQHLFQETFAEQHNALADIRATARCFWALKERDLL